MVEALGEGGCGIAYLAEQVSPVKRHVALKVIKPGMDTRSVIARFESERQILAVLDHPHIARVFDAGISRRGRPYFVMELVRGVRLTEYCTQARLTIAERLRLFNQVCLAIQHAHHRGVIHRDIKPSNVLVTLDNGNPIAKVIDFGLAKAMAASLNDRVSHTGAGQFLGTPAYVSPEQADPRQLEVDTRSDVYSLGVLLYEVLTGATPFEGCDPYRSCANFLRQILVDEPSTPSKRLINAETMPLAERASLYRASASKLIRQVSGDLDWIVMKCLEKDRNRRYQTANDLRLDLERHLKHEAVLARPPSILYTMRKAARRHQLLFAASVAGAVLGLFMVAFAITVSFQARRIVAETDRAEQEKLHAEQIANIVLKVLAAADPFENDAKEMTAPDLLDQAAQEIRDELTDGSEVRASMLEAVGRAYRRRGDAQKAIDYLHDAVRARTQMQAGGDLATLGAMIELS
ncbi:serine/threonine protein kinase, partial [Steroidobacter sp.]|uniref:serine/threonine protein kinase n=1 Tax=Steroidobacter sp. TaxID=1978227 RepID=UPI001A3E91EA